MIPVEVVGVRLEASNQPVLVLHDVAGSRFLPLWIGAPEATAITIELEGYTPERPLTHDLLVTLIEHLGDKVTSVAITELADGVFHAVINFANHEPISARPSDAVALAIRCAVPVLVAPEVMNEAGREADMSQAADDEDATEFIEEFRAFLEGINPEDF